MHTRSRNARTQNSLLLFIIMTLILSLNACNNNVDNKNNASEVKVKVEKPKVDIHTAALTGDIEAINQHIKIGKDLNKKEPMAGSTALITAVVFGKTEVAIALINAGADINIQNNDGSTALHSAAFFCHTDIVKSLIEKGADKTIRNKPGATAYESVAGEYKDVKNIYEFFAQSMGPLGLNIDFDYIEQTRPVIAAMLK